MIESFVHNRCHLFHAQSPAQEVVDSCRLAQRVPRNFAVMQVQYPLKSPLNAKANTREKTRNNTSQ